MPTQVKLIVFSLSSSSSNEYRKVINADLKKDSEVLKKSFLGKETAQNLPTGNGDLKCDLIFRGHLLQSGKSLESWGVRKESTIQVILKRIPNISQPESVSDKEIQDIFTGLQTLMKGGHTAKFAELVTNRTRLESLIEASPALGRDLFAYSLIQDVSLLAPILSDKANVHRTLQAHPCLAKATLFAIRTIIEEVGANPAVASQSARAPAPIVMPTAVSGGSSRLLGAASTQARAMAGLRQHTGSPSLYTQDFSVDQNLTEDSEDEEMEGVGEGGAGGMNRDQLMNLLNAVQSSQADTSSRSRQQHQTPRAPISADFLRSAMENAGGPSSSSSGTTRSPRPAAVPPAASTAAPYNPLDRWKAQLDTLREMGVTDAMTAIQALEATNGDIEAALNIIFG